MRIYNTKQRNQVFELFKRNPDKCFSAKDIVEYVGIDACQATVYRTLSVLVREDKIHKFRSGRGYDYYKLACSAPHMNHMHIVCLNCGDTIHANCRFIDEMGRHFLNAHDFYLDTTKTVIYGLCSKCAIVQGDGRSNG